MTIQTGQALQGRVALVTGGSGWIGNGIARHLAAAGAKVAVNYLHNTEKAQQVVQDIAQNGWTASAIRGDITDEQAVRVMISHIRDLYGPVDILVNNALGTGVPNAPIEEQRWENYLAHLDYCVKAPLFLLKAVVTDMKAKQFGRVINIGSEAFDLADPENANYVSAKGAMLGATRSWANELGSFGITVNLVAPGWIAADGHGFENGAPTAGLSNYLRSVPLNRVGLPDEVGAAVAFLASNEGGFITGQKLAVNGGRTLV